MAVQPRTRAAKAAETLAAKAPEERRRRILSAAVDVLRERGYTGTSSGLVLYHFKSLENVLAEALTTVEDEFYAEFETDLEHARGALDRLQHMGQLGAGAGPAVGDWALWLEIWVRALHDEGAKATRESLDRRWRGMLRDTIAAGVAEGVFVPDDVDDTTVRLASLMDGLAIQLALADPDMSSDRMSTLWLAAAAQELRIPPGMLNH